MEKIMNYYEVLYILNPNFNKEQIAGVMSPKLMTLLKKRSMESLITIFGEKTISI